jgi:hypothetical protein
MGLNDNENTRYRTLMERALQAARGNDGSEAAYNHLLQPLLEMEKLIKKSLGRGPFPHEEEEYGRAAWPENSSGIFELNAFLGEAIAAYERKLQQVTGSEDMIALLEQGGAAVLHHKSTFVQTDEGELSPASLANPQPVEHKTQPRLARLVARLQEIGIYTDDLIVHVCEPDPRMMRRLPYIVVHIPRLDKEIAVCDEVGEITFVAKKQVGVDVWAHLTKDELKARTEIRAIPFANEESWWDGISSTLLGEERDRRKVNIKEVAKKKPPLDLALIKASILEHRQATEKWPTDKSGPVKHGPYAEKEKWGAIDNALRNGGRGLLGGSSLVQLNEEVSKTYNLDYVNRLKQPDYEIKKIKDCILAHRQATGTWPSTTSGPVKHGPYTEKETWLAIDNALRKGVRGLLGGSSLVQLNEEVSNEHGLDYVNRLKQPDYEIEKIQDCILAHRQATGTWPTQKLGPVEYGPYAGEETWLAIDNALRRGLRGLPGGSSLAELNEEVSKTHNLDYANRWKQTDYEIEKIQDCILAHRQATGTWPSTTSGPVEYGPYAEKEKWGAIQNALRVGVRGLPGGSSLAELNEEVSKTYNLDYSNRLKQPDYETKKIKDCILAHRQATGTWPIDKSGPVKHGPYAEKETWLAIDNALRKGGRGLLGGSSLAQLNEEVSKTYNLDYVNRLKQPDYEIKKIKDCILAHRQATGTWPTQTSGPVEYGPYA